MVYVFCVDFLFVSFFLFLLILFFHFFFFFQAEDGIRDHCVTGVQTCALPIWSCDPRNTDLAYSNGMAAARAAPGHRAGRGSQLRCPARDGGSRRRLRPAIAPGEDRNSRSEERRVGKEWRARW